MWHNCLVHMNWYTFLYIREKTTLIMTKISQAPPCKIWLPGICSPLSWKCHEETILVQHWIHPFKRIIFNRGWQLCHGSGSHLTLITEAWVHFQASLCVIFFNERIDTGTSIVWALWFFLSATFHQRFIFICFIRVSQDLYNLAPYSIKKMTKNGRCWWL